MRRDLVSVQYPRTRVGAVVSDANGKRYEGHAANVLRGLRRAHGDDEVVDEVLRAGWANAAGLYFADLVPGS